MTAAYEHTTDCKGNVLHPGDKVSARRYPKGTIRGTVAVSERVQVVQPDGTTVPALVIVTDDGVSYSLPGPKSVRKLKT